MKMKTQYRSHRTLAAALAITLATSSAIMPKRAEAGLGILVTSVPGLVLSPVFIPMYYLAAIAGGAATVDKFKEASQSGSFWKYMQAGFMATFGILMLESNSEGTMDFATIDEPAARKAGLSDAERAAYNSELPMLNAVREEVLLRTDQKFAHATSAPSIEQIADTIRSQWREVSVQALSPEAVSAMEKLSESARRSL
jgi:hypothetical protein